MSKKARQAQYKSVARLAYVNRQGNAYYCTVNPYSVQGVDADWIHQYNAAAYCLDAVDPASGGHAKVFGGYVSVTVNRG